MATIDPSGVVTATAIGGGTEYIYTSGGPASTFTTTATTTTGDAASGSKWYLNPGIPSTYDDQVILSYDTATQRWQLDISLSGTTTTTTDASHHHPPGTTLTMTITATTTHVIATASDGMSITRPLSRPLRPLTPIIGVVSALPPTLPATLTAFAFNPTP